MYEYTEEWTMYEYKEELYEYTEERQGIRLYEYGFPGGEF